MLKLRLKILLLIAFTLGAFSLAYNIKSRLNNRSTPEFLAAQKIFSINCMRCHAKFGSMTEQEWVASTYIKPGRPDGSQLFRKLKNEGGNMPPDGYLASADVELLRKWITSLGRRDAAPETELDIANAAGRFIKMQNIFQKNCATCHRLPVRALSKYREGQLVPPFTEFKTENEFVEVGLLSPQSHEHSWFFIALKAADVHNSIKKSSFALSADEEKYLTTWIDHLGEP